MNTTSIDTLARQYFSDLAADQRPDTDENLAAWLWFSCPAEMREHVRQAIQQLRGKD